jgi:hypothetical protein
MSGYCFLRLWYPHRKKIEKIYKAQFLINLILEDEIKKKSK